MTTRDENWPAGTPCWVDVAVDDVDKARAFYSALFGWEIEPGAEEFGGYANCRRDGHLVAGLTPKMSADQPSVWTTYLATDDIDATMAKVREAGGQVVAEPMDVADLGRMAVAVDPGGAFVGFWQGRSHTGYTLANEPGSVTWNENFSRAWKQNQGFYASVFGWDYDDMSSEGFEYATFKVDDHIAGGIGQFTGDMPEEVPPQWRTYFKVADTDAAVAEVERLGGTAIQPAWDTEFGRMAAVTDDQGVPFMLMADNAQ
jgi:predicted enzyme related to lactoylglutathione lyase